MAFAIAATIGFFIPRVSAAYAQMRVHNTEH